jgi:hypothetical protein
MLTLTNKTVRTDDYGDGHVVVVERYSAQGYAQCDGTSIWGYTGDLQVPVSAIEVHNCTYEDGDTSTMLYVEHNAGGTGDWTIYTDRGFEASIGAALGIDCTFTEQGMQDDGVASLET